MMRQWLTVFWHWYRDLSIYCVAVLMSVMHCDRLRIGMQAYAARRRGSAKKYFGVSSWRAQAFVVCDLVNVTRMPRAGDLRGSFVDAGRITIHEACTSPKLFTGKLILRCFISRPNLKRKHRHMYVSRNLSMTMIELTPNDNDRTHANCS